jgi:GTP-binding protein HflX
VKFYTFEVKQERCLLVGLAKNNFARWQKIDSLEELAALTLTAGGIVVEKILQIRSHFDPKTLLGQGKVEELKQLTLRHKIDLLIFDEPLSPSQIRNIEDITGVRAIDRAALILDIFALHAQTAEAKMQVELAQLDYHSTRLTGFGTELSRLGGGIGTRGPGEKKLEEDRRRIRERISVLKKDLKRIEQERRQQRKQRRDFFNLSLAGYTNAGKSTLMNRLTDARVKVASYLFATLDPNTKPLILKKGVKVLLTDTVGFIKNLPHELVASFRATLSEIREADFVLQVVDATENEIEVKISVVRTVLDEIGCRKPTLVVFNKIDRLFEEEMVKRLKRSYPGAVFVSALTGEGIDGLKRAILHFIDQHLVIRTFTVPVERGDLIALLYTVGEVTKKTERDKKLQLKVKGGEGILARTRKEITAALKRK